MKQIKEHQFVLVVDDDPDIIFVFENELSDAGYLVKTALSGAEALVILRQHECFMVFSDFMMPEMNGLDLCIEVRKERPKLPFIIVSGYADKKLAVDGLRRGVSDILDKPSSEGALSRVADRFCASCQLEAENEFRENEELRCTFIEESEFLLSNLEKSIVELESSAKEEALKLIFRHIHTVKGSAGMFDDAKPIVRLAHIFETVLNAMMSRTLDISSDLITQLLSSNDILLGLIRRFNTGDLSSISIDDTVAALERFLADAKADSPPRTSTHKSAAIAFIHGAAGEEADEGVNVSNERLDHFNELAGELIVFRNLFQGWSRSINLERSSDREQMDGMVKSLGKLSDQIQSLVMDVRKVSLKKVFSKLPRAIRQVAGELGKKIELDIRGQDLQVDKTIARALAASLTHLVRNSGDHGIESPEVRRSKGKAEMGHITLDASENGDIFTLLIKDDGAGLNRERILEKALSSKLLRQEQIAGLSESSIYDLIFAAGFSTKEQVSAISGRGIGMDVVKSSLAAVGGRISISSTKDRGTSFTITIPLPKTLMIERALLVSSNNTLIAVPLGDIKEISDLQEYAAIRIQGRWTYQYRDRTIPVGSFRHLLGIEAEDLTTFSKNKNELMLVINHESSWAGLRIDAVHGQVEAVVRRFDDIIHAIPGFSGTSLLPDNRVAYVLSSKDVVQASQSRVAEDRRYCL